MTEPDDTLDKLKSQMELLVNAADTDFSAILRLASEILAQRMHRCTSCGLTLDRDWNAARNILARGLAAVEHEGV